MIIIGDVHGCYKTLLAMVEQFPDDEKIIMVGDLIDRGPSSEEVVQWAIDNKDRVRSVQGNHENMLLRSLGGEWGYLNMFLRNGGTSTFQSYRTEEQNKNPNDYSFDIFPQEHIDYFKSMPLFIEEDGLFVSHSSYCCQIPWEEARSGEGDNYSLQWNRTPASPLPNGKFHVFGHTIGSEPTVTPHFASIDTGVFWLRGKDEGNGRLTAIQFPSKKIYHQETIDDVLF